MANVTKYVNLNAASDGNGNSAATGYKYLATATQQDAATLGVQAGETYTINVVAHDSGTRPSSTSDRGPLHSSWNGRNIVINGMASINQPSTQPTPKLGGTYIAYCPAEVLSGSIRVVNVDWSGAEVGIRMSNTSGRDIDVTIESGAMNCTVLNDASNYGYLVWNGNAGNAGDITIRDCTVSDCLRIVYGGARIGLLTIENNSIACNVASVGTVDLVNATTMDGIIVRGSQITSRQSAGGFFTATPALTGAAGSIVIDKSNLDFSAVAGSNSVIRIADVGGSYPLSVTIADSTIKTNSAYPAVYLGLTTTTAKRWKVYRDSCSKLWGTVSVTNSRAINVYTSSSSNSGSLWLHIGPNEAVVDKCFLKNSNADGHGFYIACDDAEITNNVSVGHLPILAFGDDGVYQHNTVWADGTGIILGKPGLTSWEPGTGNTIDHNIFVTTSARAVDNHDAALNDYAYRSDSWSTRYSQNNHIDQNCYWATEAGTALANINSTDCSTISAMQAAWSGWNNQWPGNDSSSVAVNPGFQDVDSEFREAFTPTAEGLWLDDGTYMGAMIPPSVLSSIQDQTQYIPTEPATHEDIVAVLSALESMNSRMSTLSGVTNIVNQARIPIKSNNAYFRTWAPGETAAALFDAPVIGTNVELAISGTGTVTLTDATGHTATLDSGAKVFFGKVNLSEISASGTGAVLTGKWESEE